MRIVGVAMVCNEADIIETFVRYHLQILDELIVTDHRSSDGCAEILQALAEEDPRLILLHDRRAGMFQREVMTHTMRMAARRMDADWVVALDGDEFLSTDGRLGIREVIGRLPAERPVRIPWRGYVPLPRDGFTRGNVLARIQHRRLEEPRVYSKVLVPRYMLEKECVEIRGGNHSLLDNSRVRPKIRGAPSPDLFLGHFPVRTSPQMIKKAVIGWLCRLAVHESDRTVGYNKHPLFSRLKSGAELAPQELTDMAFAYPSRETHFPPAGRLVLAPIPHDAAKLTLRYESLVIDSPLQALATYAELLAKELSAHRATQPWAGASVPMPAEPVQRPVGPQHRLTGRWDKLREWAALRRSRGPEIR